MLTEPELDALLQRMQSCLVSPEFIDEPRLSEDARAYSGICTELNRKLTEAAKLIDKGLRDDALRLLGPENEVIELFERCEFPEREDWSELTEIYGIPAPPRLNFDAAAKVNLTFAVLGSLEGLLKNHRILNLSRAPLPARMQLLHTLATRDSSNPIWQEDLVNFRKVRSQQLVAEVDKAVISESYDQIEALQRELTSPVWNGDADPKLIVKLNTSLAACEQRGLLHDLQIASQKLQSAYAEFDVAAGLQLSNDVVELFDRANLPTDAPMVVDLQPALGWVEAQRRDIQQQQRDNQLITLLEQSLENATQLEPIELAYQRALAMGSRFPEVLQKRAIERIEAFQLQAKRRLIAIVGSISAVLLALAVGLGFWIYTSQQETKARQVELTLAELISQERLDEAEVFAQKQNPHLQQRTAFQASLSDITTLRTKEAARAKEFANLLDELKRDESPQPNDSLLKKLLDVTKTVEDKLAYREQESLIEKKRLLLREMKQKQILEKFNALEVRVQETLSAPNSAQSIIEKLRLDRADIRKFIRNEIDGHATVEDVAQQLDRRIESEIERLTISIQAEKDLQDITSCVGNVSKYQSALIQYIQKYPATTVATIQVTEQVKRISEDSLWLDLISDPIIANPLQASLETAFQWISRYNEARKLNEDHCLHPVVREVAEVIRLKASVKNVIADLRQLARAPLLDEMYVYTALKAKYYSPNKPREDRSTIDYFTDFTMSTAEKDFGKSFKTAVLPRVYRAGHSEFGRKFRLMLEANADEQLDTACTKILNELHSVPSAQIDPFFRLKLYRALLGKMIPASPPIAAGFKDFSDQLTEDVIDWDTNWLSVETENPELNRQREQATKLLSMLDDWDSRFQRVQNAIKNIPKARITKLEWIGWVYPNKETKTLLFPKELSEKEELFVLVNEAGKGRVQKLGKPAERTILLSDPSILPGAAVYVMRTNSGAN